MSSSTAIKIQYNGDIRRTNLTSTSFEEFKTVIAQLFGEAAAGQKVRYVDEDGDRVLVCNAEDIAEAFKHAKIQKRTIKFFVEAQAKTHEEKAAAAPTKQQETLPDLPKRKVYVTDEPEPTKTSDNNNTNDGGVYPSIKEARRLEKEARHAAKQAKKSERRAEQKARKEEYQKAKHSDGCRWREQWRQHAREFRQKREVERKQFEEDMKSFLSDAKVVKALQDIVPSVTESLLKGDNLKLVLDKALEAQPVLKEHKLTQRLLPLAHQVLEILVPFGDFVRPALLDVILDLQVLLAKGKLEDMPFHRLMKRIFRAAKRSSPCFGGMPMMFGGFGPGGACPFPPFGMGDRNMGGCRPGMGRFGRF